MLFTVEAAYTRSNPTRHVAAVLQESGLLQSRLLQI